MLLRIRRLLRTVRYIKPVQAVFQLRNRLLRTKPFAYYKNGKEMSPSAIVLCPYPSAKNSIVSEDKKFNFLNLTVEFRDTIDWNHDVHGKLWNYNLQYLDYVNQEDLSEEVRISWVRDLYSSLNAGNVKLEPYPVSLRSMNLIRFFCTIESRINEYDDVLQDLHAELTYLNLNYEYHLLGNHVLENAFAMLMGGTFFKDEKWSAKACEILIKELNEQILNDGAHFELSPMYHQIILFRALEAISYLNSEEPLNKFLREKVALMLGWLKQVTFSNGDIPHFNDSTEGISFNTSQLCLLASSLGIKDIPRSLKDSGYRKFTNDPFEMVCDLHGISPKYQPGHNHADHLSFVLYTHQQPFIVDPGTSTYNISARRQWERSSKAHNTVTVRGENQSEVWGGFRVGRRAMVTILNDDQMSASGLVQYRASGLKILHKRVFSISENVVNISDTVNLDELCEARFYLHPNISVVELTNSSVKCNNQAVLNFDNVMGVEVNEYDFSTGFNQLVKGKVIKANFIGSCETTIIAG